MKYLLIALVFYSCYTPDKITGEKWKYGQVKKINGLYVQARVNREGKKEIRTCEYKWTHFYSFTK